MTAPATLERAWDSLRATAARPHAAAVLNSSVIVIVVVFLYVLLKRGIATEGGDGGIDAYAYWAAGRNVLAGLPFYNGASGDFASYLYPPIFAQLVSPLALLPLGVFVWLWRALEFACLRYVMGSWRATGLAMFLWLPVYSEIDIANANLLIAAAVAAAIRGDARVLPLSVLTKFASLAAFPAAWRADRRGLLIGSGLVAIICAVSFILTPTAWYDYARFLGGAHEPPGGQGWLNVGAFIWTPLRLGLAAVCAMAAWRWRRLAAVAVTLALPVLWFPGLVVLTALWARPGGGNGWGRARG